ncbi:LiaI-LiaF-like domain-containing protein [Sunxiuqinia sp. sy24]|uniref:LiaI-LiaF-like domain-containing protein n=1 Tax=Sunxiuqinia sp. sy24 TaxID=3461495 RepID=UPI0040455F74
MDNKRNKRFYLGVVLIAIGGFMILERLGLIPWSIVDLLISWQMLLVAIGIISWLGGNRTGGLILMAIGGFFLLPEFIEVPRQLRRLYWPMVLVAGGVLVLLRHSGSGAQPTEGIGGRDLDQFDDFVIFGGREIFINSQNLKGGRATSIFGGIEYDFRQSQLAPQGAVIDSLSIFGGCSIKVPLEWNVRNEVTTMFGAFTDKRGDTFQHSQYNPSKTLVIRGFTILGGFEVKHV